MFLTVISQLSPVNELALDVLKCHLTCGKQRENLRERNFRVFGQGFWTRFTDVCKAV